VKGFKLIDLIKQNSGVSFCLMWLAVTTGLSVLSGWFRLMLRFPNRDEAALLQIRMIGGRMGMGVSLRGILTLSACPSGLRVGMLRLFGPFCRDFFVPWESIAVTRETSVFSLGVKLNFGNPVIGTLCIDPDVATQLSMTASGRWKTGSCPEEGRQKDGRREFVRRLLTQWAMFSGAWALLCVFASLVSGPGPGHPPLLVEILFPTILFGVINVVRFLADAAEREQSPE
jgi:hypothetical protein